MTAIVTFFGDLLSTGVGIVFTREIGAMRKDRANEIYGQGLILSVGIGLLSAFMIFALQNVYFSVAGITGDILKHALEYYRLVPINAFLTIVIFYLEQMIYSDGDELCNNICYGFQIGGNIIFSVILTRFLGMTGIILGSVIGNSLGILTCFWHYFRKENTLRFVKANGTSPSIMLSMLVDEAIRRQHPDINAPVVSNIPISIRRQLGCEETFKNCSSRIQMSISGTPMDALPFDQRAVQLRSMLKQQMNPDIIRTINNAASQMYRARMEQATDFREEVSKPARFTTQSHDTFYLDYIGSMHKTAYADQMTDIRFLCQPAAGNTLHLNVIEHCGEFRVDFLAMYEIPGIIESLEQVLRDHSLTFKSIPMQHFTLPMAAWREDFI